MQRLLYGNSAPRRYDNFRQLDLIRREQVAPNLTTQAIYPRLASEATTRSQQTPRAAQGSSTMASRMYPHLKVR
jgi:hypothetical protein